MGLKKGFGSVYTVSQEAEIYGAPKVGFPWERTHVFANSFIEDLHFYSALILR
jgi:hypothetical protein